VRLKAHHSILVCGLTEAYLKAHEVLVVVDQIIVDVQSSVDHAWKFVTPGEAEILIVDCGVRKWSDSGES